MPGVLKNAVPREELRFDIDMLQGWKIKTGRFVANLPVLNQQGGDEK